MSSLAQNRLNRESLPTSLSPIRKMFNFAGLEVLMVGLTGHNVMELDILKFDNLHNSLKKKRGNKKIKKEKRMKEIKMR